MDYMTMCTQIKIA